MKKLFLLICLKKLDMVLLELESRKIVLIAFLFKLIQSNLFFYFRLLKDSGYKLKNQFKNMTEPFSVVVAAG